MQPKVSQSYGRQIDWRPKSGRTPATPAPGGGYFGPRFRATYENGEVVDSPPLAAVDADVLNAWRLRADGLTTPTLKAHYADLIWDLGPKVLAGARREPHFARLAKQTQVLFLTHHEHLADLARTTLTPANVSTCRLGELRMEAA